MISKIRENVMSLKDKKIRFRYNGSRNQIEEFDGVITDWFNFIFIINTDNLKRSFSYADVFIGVLEVNI